MTNIHSATFQRLSDAKQNSVENDVAVFNESTRGLLYISLASWTGINHLAFLYLSSSKFASTHCVRLIALFDYLIVGLTLCLTRFVLVVVFLYLS